MDNKLKILEIYNEILHPVNTRYGAPMGRTDTGNEQTDAKGKRIYKRRIYLFDGKCYDKGDAYGGCGSPLYVRFTLDKEFVEFVRD